MSSIDIALTVISVILGFDYGKKIFKRYNRDFYYYDFNPRKAALQTGLILFAIGMTLFMQYFLTGFNQLPLMIIHASLAYILTVLSASAVLPLTFLSIYYFVYIYILLEGRLSVKKLKRLKKKNDDVHLDYLLFYVNYQIQKILMTRCGLKLGDLLLNPKLDLTIYEITAILRQTKTFTEIVKEVTPHLIETILSENNYSLEKRFLGLRRFDSFAKWYDSVSLNESCMFGPIVFDKKDKTLIAIGKKRPSLEEISEFFENKKKMKKAQEKIDE